MLNVVNDLVTHAKELPENRGEFGQTPDERTFPLWKYLVIKHYITNRLGSA